MATPITNNPKTSMMLDYATMKSLNGDLIKAWADQLLNIGIAPESVVDAAVGSSIPPEKIDETFQKICDDVGIDIENGFVDAKEAAYIDEYRAGFYKAPHVFHVCNRFRKSTGFPEMVEACFKWDGNKEIVTYRGLETGMTGDELDELCKRHLAANGIERKPQNAG